MNLPVLRARVMNRDETSPPLDTTCVSSMVMSDIAARMAEVDGARARGEPTVPTTIALERATNPFMRASTAAELAERRAAKDAFR